MASCAACLQPLFRGQPFVLDGTEVFHRACLSQAYRSKLRVAEQSVRDLEAKLTDTRAAAARVEAEANLHRNLSTQRHAEVLQLSGRLHDRAHQLILEEQRRIEVEQQLRASQAEASALRRELAAAQAAARPAEQPAEEQDQDASAQRFKMLELD